MALVDRVTADRAWRRLIAVGVVIAGAGPLTSCADDSSAEGGDATVLDVSLGRFVIEPAVLTAPAGDLELRVTNVDPDMQHNLAVNGKGTRTLAPGETQTLHMQDVAAGDYRMWCDMPGHAAAGQVGTLAVEAARAPTTTSP
jgi:nitrite reductase (NO-forming)